MSIESDIPTRNLTTAPLRADRIMGALSDRESLLKKRQARAPIWVRFVAGVLGFLSSLLALAIPAIVLLIVDRLIPSENLSSLGSLLGLGLGMAVSICLIDLMRMRALESYFTNVRGLVLYQDACFAFFWLFVMAFLHPLVPLVALSAGGLMLVMWMARKRRAIAEPQQPQARLDPVMIDAVGLAPAYIQKSASGEIQAEEQPDFQTINQASFLNLITMLSALGAIGLTAWLHITGQITLGSMFAVIFLNQFVTNVLVRFYQVQALRPVPTDLSQFSMTEFVERTSEARPAPSEDELAILSIQELEAKGFAPFSADLFQGLCLALIGPSGSGKSEILRAIATGEFDEGKISFKGRNWGRNHGQMSSLAYAPPRPVSLQGSIVQNVTCFDPQASALPAIELIRKLDPYEDVFGDCDFIHEEMDPNVAAQGQIVALARSFWRDTDIIVLDSPETFLDKASRSSLLALILEAKTNGKIVILATDDEYLMSVADEMVKLERGEVTDRGPKDEVLARFHQRWVRVSFAPNKREAFRLSLWLEAQFPLGMSEGLKSRVKQAAQDMLFLAPRDQVLDLNEEVLFDVRMSPTEVQITMHDKGDLIDEGSSGGEMDVEYTRIQEAADGFEQTLREGYRQFAVRFAQDRASVEALRVAEG